MKLKYVGVVIVLVMLLGAMVFMAKTPQPQNNDPNYGFNAEEHGDMTVLRGNDLESTPEQRQGIYEQAKTQKHYLWIDGTAKGVDEQIDHEQLKEDMIKVEFLLQSAPKDKDESDVLFKHVEQLMSPMAPGPDGQVTIEFTVDMTKAASDSLLRIITTDPDKGTPMMPIIWLPVYPSEGKFAPVLFSVAPDERGYKEDLYVVRIFRFEEQDGGVEEFGKFVADVSSDVLEQKALQDANTRET